MAMDTDGPPRPARIRTRHARRDFLLLGLAVPTVGSLWLARTASAQSAAPSPDLDRRFDEAARPALAGLAALGAQDVQNGGLTPFPIPWLDKNGSFNQAPGPGQEASNIFHFKGRIARSNGFTGMGTDNQGRRIPFGTITTDYSFMQGVYWAARGERPGAFTHT
ncbi:MAG TPA: hypothetical protein VMG58_00525 [Candidatus Sulfotelmatobacter sp.]|nr:hypothetical protein [Candidatus Sulfotelmatobacter sp.]